MRRIWLGLLVAGVLGQGAMAAERDRYLVQLKPGAEAAVLAVSKVVSLFLFGLLLAVLLLVVVMIGEKRHHEEIQLKRNGG